MLFQTSFNGKWILAGEHTVILGERAIALPYPDYELKLTAKETTREGLSFHPAELASLVKSLIQKTETLLPVGLSQSLLFESNIPTGAGLGSSAALSLALTEWISHVLKRSLTFEEKIKTAKAFEDYFHGTSSGLDLSVIAKKNPIVFRNGKIEEELKLSKLPHFTLHDTGTRSSTKDCVEKVMKQRKENPKEAILTDQEMILASKLAREGLLAFADSKTETANASALHTLSTAMNHAQKSFERWGLVPIAAQEMIRALKAKGALSVKMTGSGGGGFLVALWNQ